MFINYCTQSVLLGPQNMHPGLLSPVASLGVSKLSFEFQLKSQLHCFSMQVVTNKCFLLNLEKKLHRFILSLEKKTQKTHL